MRTDLLFLNGEANVKFSNLLLIVEFESIH